MFGSRYAGEKINPLTKRIKKSKMARLLYIFVFNIDVDINRNLKPHINNIRSN